LKTSIWAKVDHPFHVMKHLFRHERVRERVLVKNTMQLLSLFRLANLVIAKGSPLDVHARGVLNMH
jgi:IS5 family transposase